MTCKERSPDRVRLFCGLRLPADALDGLVAWQRVELARGRLRVVPRDHLHVTLAFLGTRPAGEIPAIVGALRDAATGADRLVLEPVRYRETRSVGMVVFADEGARAAALAGDLHRRLAELGVYEPEHRPWLPHVTVARFRARSGLTLVPPALGRLSPSDAALYNSVLRSGGAQYEVLESVALGG